MVGLDLCPFAAEPLAQGRVRFAVSGARQASELARDLALELARLADSPPDAVETTLLIAPDVLSEFEDFNQFLGVADIALESLALVGVVQVVGFHPQFRFEGALPDEAGNYANRSPHPMLHLLREASVERAVEGLADPDSIPARNLATLGELGSDELARRLASIGGAVPATQ